METNIGADLKRATASLKISMDTIMKDCVAKLETQHDQVLQQLTPYDSEDAKRVLDKQKVQLLDTLETTNAALVSENSRVRVHHSFMPIRYREETERMQQQDNQLYSEQRSNSQDHLAARFGQPRRHHQARRGTASTRNGATLPPRLRICQH